MQKDTYTFFSKNIRIYAIFNNRSFNDVLTKEVVSFEQLGPECFINIALGRLYLNPLSLNKPCFGG